MKKLSYLFMMLFNRGMFKNIKEDAKTCQRMLQAMLSGQYKRIPTESLLKAALTLIYFIFPLDIIPDFIPFFGQMDDFAVFLWFLGSLKKDIDLFKSFEHARTSVED